MSDQMMTRRLLIKRGSQFSAAAAMTLSLAACGKSGSSAGGKLVCNDPAKDSAETKEMRTSYHYVEAFTEAEKTCANCAFYVPSDDAAKCGTCKVLLGTVNSTGHCDSFSAKT